ncbi:MAG TPA: hypothetical protein VGP93_03545, partial [Polyangiaceae bacterium]|nr:hypothetical protein [Polyangiaceae bacterium]
MWDGATALLASAPALGMPSLPLTRLTEVSWFHALINYSPIKALLPLPILAAIAPAVWWFFRSTWREVDIEAAELRRLRGDTFDLRPAVCMAMVAAILTIQEYYGGRSFYDQLFRPMLSELEGHGWTFLKLAKYDELYSYAWWSLARIVGYVLVPFPLWKLIFRKDSLLDMGLRGRGFLSHLWIYGLCLSVVIPVMLVVAAQPDFGNYYPFYKQSSRSIFDLVCWEVMYGLQFLALELFFRGFILSALRPA